MTIENNTDPDEQLLRAKATASLFNLVVYQAGKSMEKMEKLTHEANELLRKALKLTEEKSEPK